MPQSSPPRPKREPRFHRLFNYDRRLLPNRRLAELDEGVADVETARERSGLTIGYPGWGVLYHVLLSHLKPEGFNGVVETGTNRGCSTIVLAQALVDSGRAGHVHTIELEPENVRLASENLSAAGVSDRVTVHTGNSLDLLPGVVAGLPSIRVAFLDGSHEHRNVVAEFEAVVSKLEPQGLVLFDNTYPLTQPPADLRVNGALREILRTHGGHLVNLEYVSWYTPGLAMWQREPLAEL